MTIAPKRDRSVKPGRKRDFNDGGFHSTFIRDRGDGPGPAMAKPEYLSRPDQDDMAQRLESSAMRKVPGGFPRGDSPARHRKTKLAVMGLSKAILDEGNPNYAACVRQANAYRKIRTRELCIAHGYVSSGVSSLLAAASLALSGSRFLYQAAATAETEAERREILKTASKLAADARQNDLSAWELCSREAVIRKRNDSAGEAQPWIIESYSPSGKPTNKGGRPRKAQQASNADIVESQTEANYGEDSDWGQATEGYSVPEIISTTGGQGG